MRHAEVACLCAFWVQMHTWSYIYIFFCLSTFVPVCQMKFMRIDWLIGISLCISFSGCAFCHLFFHYFYLSFSTLLSSFFCVSFHVVFYCYFLPLLFHSSLCFLLLWSLSNYASLQFVTLCCYLINLGDPVVSASPIFRVFTVLCICFCTGWYYWMVGTSISWSALAINVDFSNVYASYLT